MHLRHPSHPPLLPETARRHDLIDLHGLAKRLPPVLAVSQLAHRVNHTPYSHPNIDKKPQLYFNNWGK